MSHSSELDADPEIAAARRRVEVAQEKHKILAELALAAQQTEAGNARLVVAAAGLAGRTHGQSAMAYINSVGLR